MTVAGVCVAGYILAGFVENVFVVLGCSMAAMIAVLLVIKKLKRPEAVSLQEGEEKKE
jgi:hypothetical protein